MKYGKTMSEIVDRTEGLLNKHQETKWLYETAAMVPAGRNILEIGSFKGLSSVCLGHGALVNKNYVFCVDYFRYFSDWKNVMMTNNLYKVYPLAGDANVILKEVKIKNLGMIFIDSSHSYEDCKLQLELALENFSGECVVGFHDYEHPDYPGVKQYCDELTSSSFWSEVKLTSSIFSGIVRR